MDIILVNIRAASAGTRLSCSSFDTVVPIPFSETGKLRGAISELYFRDKSMALLGYQDMWVKTLTGTHNKVAVLLFKKP